MIHTKRVDHTDLDFQELVQLLDAELAERDGAENQFYAQFNGIEALKNVILVMKGNQAVACGAFKPFDEQAVEIKRMYVRQEQRGKGYAGKVLAALETWARDLGYTRIILETGKRQYEAVGLYQKHQYERIKNFEPYLGIANSLCFAKTL
ncbi:MAG TPA: GNAT family N-acetyltransferase [Saprospiraceae bacterium]|nr:GNAT family N-acetyltransferase [Saprospiraceae bacterium]